MNRWLASRWLVLTVVLSAAAWVLAYLLRDAAPFTAVATVGLGGGWAHNATAKVTASRRYSEQRTEIVRAPRADWEEDTDAW